MYHKYHTPYMLAFIYQCLCTQYHILSYHLSAKLIESIQYMNYVTKLIH